MYGIRLVISLTAGHRTSAISFRFLFRIDSGLESFFCLLILLLPENISHLLLAQAFVDELDSTFHSRSDFPLDPHPCVERLFLLEQTTHLADRQARLRDVFPKHRSFLLRFVLLHVQVHCYHLFELCDVRDLEPGRHREPEAARLVLLRVLFLFQRALDIEFVAGSLENFVLKKVHVLVLRFHGKRLAELEMR